MKYLITLLLLCASFQCVAQTFVVYQVGDDNYRYFPNSDQCYQAFDDNTLSVQLFCEHGEVIEYPEVNMLAADSHATPLNVDLYYYNTYTQGYDFVMSWSRCFGFNPHYFGVSANLFMECIPEDVIFKNNFSAL